MNVKLGQKKVIFVEQRNVYAQAISVIRKPSCILKTLAYNTQLNIGAFENKSKEIPVGFRCTY